MKFTEVRSTVPLSEADFAAIRAKVMATVEQQEKRSGFVFRFAFALVAIAVIGATTLLLMPRRIALEPQAPPLHQRSLWGPALAGRSSPAESGPHTPVTSEAAIRPKHRKRPPRPAALHTAQVRMEIHTSDPDVRIIWIAR